MSTLVPRVITTPLQLRYGDTDALGHVNNAVFASFAEVGRIAFVKAVDLPLANFILARIAMDFRRQVYLLDDVTMTTEISEIGNSSITFTQIVFANGEVAAEIEAVAVWFDFDTQRPIRVPDHVRELAYETS